MYQYALAGLTPQEYYSYVTTGVYPCDSYYGVTADDMMSVSDLVVARLETARKKEERVRERNRERREEAEQFMRTPESVVASDQLKLHREKSKWTKSRKIAEVQIEHIDSIIEKTKEALKFICGASKELLSELKYPQNWKKHKELDYVFEMNELF